jgi:glycine hydroxymethyltransferase
VNKNTVPFDSRSPFITSGVRIGTPALTTRGMKEPEMKKIAELMARVLEAHDDADVLASVRKDARDICDSFPLYAELQ